ncbi:hypothetical protein LTS10_003811 [Elasticomyces elasticus]|nr:hypothetical protein LTS10_003811 [Elasticomyces elasticus]
MSISFMLARIAVAKRPWVIGLYAISSAVTTLLIVGFFYIIFRCTPVSYSWDQSTPGGHCQPDYILANIWYVTTGINIALDWYCALLPIPLLWHVPLDRRTKISVGFLLSLGVLASIAACVRQKYTVVLTHSHDLERSLGNLMIWGYAEVGIGFFAGCLSTLRPLFVVRPARRTNLLSQHKMEDLNVQAEHSGSSAAFPSTTEHPTPAVRASEDDDLSDRILITKTDEFYHARTTSSL